MAIARRLDRLAARAHRFHRFAHHPLCRAYADETVRLGRRTRVCRGCAAVVMGAVVGVALGFALPVPPAVVLVMGLILLAPVAFVAAVGRRDPDPDPLTPTLSPGGGEGGRDLDPDPAREEGGRDLDRRAIRRGRRASKLLTRTLPSAFAAGLAVLGARAASGTGLAAAAGVVALVAGGALAYRRRGPNRSPCAVCPERERPQVCSGFAPLARREKAFSRLAGRLLRAVPPSPSRR